MASIQYSKNQYYTLGEIKLPVPDGFYYSASSLDNKIPNGSLLPKGDQRYSFVVSKNKISSLDEYKDGLFGYSFTQPGDFDTKAWYLGPLDDIVGQITDQLNTQYSAQYGLDISFDCIVAQRFFVLLCATFMIGENPKSDDFWMSITFSAITKSKHYSGTAFVNGALDKVDYKSIFMDFIRRIEPAKTEDINDDGLLENPLNLKNLIEAFGGTVVDWPGKEEQDRAKEEEKKRKEEEARRKEEEHRKEEEKRRQAEERQRKAAEKQKQAENESEAEKIKEQISSLDREFQSNSSKTDAREQEIRSEIATLEGKKKALGLFHGKEKAEIKSQIEALRKSIQSLQEKQSKANSQYEEKKQKLNKKLSILQLKKGDKLTFGTQPGSTNKMISWTVSDITGDRIKLIADNTFELTTYNKGKEWLNTFSSSAFSYQERGALVSNSGLYAQYPSYSDFSGNFVPSTAKPASQVINRITREVNESAQRMHYTSLQVSNSIKSQTDYASKYWIEGSISKGMAPSSFGSCGANADLGVRPAIYVNAKRLKDLYN